MRRQAALRQQRARREDHTTAPTGPEASARTAAPAPQLAATTTASASTPAARRHASGRPGRFSPRSSAAISRPIQDTGCPTAR